MTATQGPPTVTYLPGLWFALAYGDVVLLAETTPASGAGPVAAACWTAASNGAGFDGVLGAIVQAGPHEVPSFALVGPSGDGDTRLAMSGQARVERTVDGRSDPEVVTATDSSTWTEQRVPGRPALRLLAGPADALGQLGALPLAAGVALASVVGIGVTADAAGAPPAAQTEAPPVAPTEGLPAPVIEAPPVAAAPEPPAPSASADPDPRPVSNDTMPPRSDFDSGLIDSLPWRSPSTDNDGSPGQPAQAEASQASEAAPPQPVVPAWGQSQQPEPPSNPQNPWAPVQPAWPEPVAPPAWAPPPPPGQQPQSSSPWPDPAPAQPAWPQPGTAPSGTSNPWAPPTAAGAPPVTSAPGDIGRHLSADDPSAPVVHAFACPRQHLNPPYAGTCRICHEPIPPQEGFAAPRPSLGVLTLSTGDTVPLDRDVVLGRAPFHPDENVASRPHLVQLASPGNDISRSHVRVNLENWFVQVTDLGSTNGTVVTLPDQAPVRLRAHDPFTILPGTTVNIADEVTLRYEVPS